METVKRLESLSVFRSLPHAALRELAHRCEEVAFGAREVVMEQGGDSDIALLLIEGRLEVSVETSGIPHHIAVIEPGEVVGESALYTIATPRNATVMANKDSRCLVLRPGDIQGLVHNPALAALEVQILGSLTRRIRRTNTEIQTAWKEEQAAPAALTFDEEPLTMRKRLRRIFKGRVKE